MMLKAKDVRWSLLAIIAVMLSAGMAVMEDGAGGVVVKGEALSVPPHAPFVDSIPGPSLEATTRGDALAKGYGEDELGEGRGVGARRGAFLSTSGSFTLSSGGGSRAGNEEEQLE